MQFKSHFEASKAGQPPAPPAFGPAVVTDGSAVAGCVVAKNRNDFFCLYQTQTYHIHVQIKIQKTKLKKNFKKNKLN